MLVLGDLTQVAGHQEEKREAKWLAGTSNGSGDPFPSAEVNNKKANFWAGFVAGRRTIAILLRVVDKRITETRGTPGSSSQCKKKKEQSLLARERRKILQWNPIEK